MSESKKQNRIPPLDPDQGTIGPGSCSTSKETPRGTVIAHSYFPKDEGYRFISGSQIGKRPMFTPPTRSKEPSDYLAVPLRIALGLSFLFPVADRLGISGLRARRE